MAVGLAKEGSNIALGDLRVDDDATSFLNDLRSYGVNARYDRSYWWLSDD
jgi:hypothetical protein